MCTLPALRGRRVRWTKPGSFTGRRSQRRAHPAWPKRLRKKNRKHYHNRIRRFEMKFIAKSTGSQSGRRCARSVLAIVTVGLAAGSLAMAQMKVKSRGEGTAVNAMLSAQDPDARIKASEDLLAKYADTSFKAYALYIEADAWQR